MQIIKGDIPVRKRYVSLIIGGLLMLPLSGMAFGNAADQGQEAPVTPATAIHGTPGNTPGHSDQVKGAAPAGTADGADGGIHNIAGVQANGTDAPNGTPPACTAHGGLDTVNTNC